jgi:hypothetical protein
MLTIQSFLNGARGRTLAEIHQLIDEEIRQADRVADREWRTRDPTGGAQKYVESLRMLGFFLASGRRPIGITEEEFLLYRPLAEDLVARNNLVPAVLGVFSESES